MTLTATQARILRDMAGGAELFRGITGKYNLRWYAGHDLNFRTISPSTFDRLFAAALITRNGLVDGHMARYTLTPAGAEAAREGTE